MLLEGFPARRQLPRRVFSRASKRRSMELWEANLYPKLAAGLGEVVVYILLVL